MTNGQTTVIHSFITDETLPSLTRVPLKLESGWKVGVLCVYQDDMMLYAAMRAVELKSQRSEECSIYFLLPACPVLRSFALYDMIWMNDSHE